ncbi:MAG: recombination regulator RecX [Victivallales bacterium]|jgi:regulatory protein|nr:recombination regulator RecX [Victivallales bacterium]
MNKQSEKPKYSAMEKSMRLLTSRALTERELYTKLKAAGYTSSEIRDAIAECRKRGFVNDEAFAEDYADILASRGLGNKKIKMELYKRGIPRQLQEQPLEKTAENESERAMQALEYKLRLLAKETDPRKKREKAFRFLVGRGFSFDSCQAAIGKIDFTETLSSFPDDI